MSRECCGKEPKDCFCSSMSEKPRRVETIEAIFRARRDDERREAKARECMRLEWEREQMDEELEE